MKSRRCFLTAARSQMTRHTIVTLVFMLCKRLGTCQALQNRHRTRGVLLFMYHYCCVPKYVTLLIRSWGLTIDTEYFKSRQTLTSAGHPLSGTYTGFPAVIELASNIKLVAVFPVISDQSPLSTFSSLPCLRPTRKPR